MAYFRKLTNQLVALQELLKREDNWMIMINADPDAMAGALALSRLIRLRVHTVTIARINEVTRPDNLSMIRYLRIPVVKWEPALARGFQRFAIVDSQPHHSPAFDDVNFSVIIDHHPLPQNPYPAQFKDIRPVYGTTSTIMTEYLYNAAIRPGRRLATALQYGIRTDTNTFGRDTSEVDIRAYHYLARFAEPGLLTRIMRSEYLPEWLPYFSRAFDTLRPCGSGHFTSLEDVESPDLLVVVADFFLRVHGLRWVVVCGKSKSTVVVIFRGGFGTVDMGRLASAAFGDVGSAGGHRSMARAEFPVEALGKESLDDFTFRRTKAAASAHGKPKRMAVLMVALKTPPETGVKLPDAATGTAHRAKAEQPAVQTPAVGGKSTATRAEPATPGVPKDAKPQAAQNKAKVPATKADVRDAGKDPKKIASPKKAR